MSLAEGRREKQSLGKKEREGMEGEGLETY